MIYYDVQKWLEKFDWDDSEETSEALATICEALQEYPKYRALGTVEELKEASEKQKSRREWYQKGYQDGLNADKWIPVKKRLPKFEEEVLVDCGDIDVYSLERDFDDVPIWKDKYGEQHDFDSVIAWQELPALYKKEGGE